VLRLIMPQMEPGIRSRVARMPYVLQFDRLQGPIKLAIFTT
jgi:hypothetical protein